METILGISKQFEWMPPEITMQVNEEIARYSPQAFRLKQIRWENEREGDLQGLDCQKCRNKGYIAYLNDRGEEIHKECDCMTQRRTLKKMERSGLGKLLQKYTFENYNVFNPWQQRMKEMAQEFAESPYGWLYIGGQTGSGKTHLCTAVCSRLMQKGYEVRYLLWRDLFHQLESNRFNGDALDAIMNEIRMVDVVYIDDFLKSHGSQERLAGALDFAFEIVNDRYNAEKTTIISSEWLIGELQSIANATTGRIVEMTGEHLIQVARDPSKNYRLQNFI